MRSPCQFLESKKGQQFRVFTFSSQVKRLVAGKPFVQDNALSCFVLGTLEDFWAEIAGLFAAPGLSNVSSYTIY